MRVTAPDRRAFVPHDIYSRKRRRAKKIRDRKAISGNLYSPPSRLSCNRAGSNRDSSLAPNAFRRHLAAAELPLGEPLPLKQAEQGYGLPTPNTPSREQRQVGSRPRKGMISPHGLIEKLNRLLHVLLISSTEAD